MLTNPTLAECQMMTRAMLTGGTIGFFLSLALELNGLPMNWLDRVAFAGAGTLLTMIGVVISLRNQR